MNGGLELLLTHGHFRRPTGRRSLVAVVAIAQGGTGNEAGRSFPSTPQLFQSGATAGTEPADDGLAIRNGPPGRLDTNIGVDRDNAIGAV